MPSSPPDRHAAHLRTTASFGRRRSADDVIDDHGNPGAVGQGMGTGVKWMGISQIIGQVARVLMVFVLAMLLEPVEFGVVSLVMVLTGFFDRVLGDTGTTSAIVRHPTLNHGLASSVFWWNITIGLSTSLFFAALGTPISLLLNDDRTADIARVVGLLALVNAFGHVQRGLLRRLRAFRSLASVNLSNALVTAVASVSFAFAGWGEWAIVIGNITGSVASVGLAWVLSPWRPGRYFSRTELRQISSFSANLSVQNLFGYLTFAGDRFLVGVLLGPTQLGYYGLSNRLLRYPLQTSAQTYREVVFPTLARVQDDNEAMRRTYGRTVNGIAFLLLPLCLIVAATADPMVRALLGEKWIPATDVIAIMALVGALQSIATTTGSIYLAKGRTDLSLRWQVFSSIVMVTAYSIGAFWGIAGVAWGFFVGTVLLTYPAFRIPLGLIDARPGVILRPVIPTAIASLAAAAGAWGVIQFVGDAGHGPWAQLVSGGAVGCLVYGAYVVVARPQAMRDLKSALRGRRGRTRTSDPGDGDVGLSDA